MTGPAESMLIEMRREAVDVLFDDIRSEMADISKSGMAFPCYLEMKEDTPAGENENMWVRSLVISGSSDPVQGDLEYDVSLYVKFESHSERIVLATINNGSPFMSDCILIAALHSRVPLNLYDNSGVHKIPQLWAASPDGKDFSHGPFENPEDIFNAVNPNSPPEGHFVIGMSKGEEIIVQGLIGPEETVDWSCDSDLRVEEIPEP